MTNKTIKLANRIITVLIAVLAVTNISFAILDNLSIFTPDRPYVAYHDGMESFYYPSFNNFYPNNNIPGAFARDERSFLVGRYCEDGDCTGSLTYANTLKINGESGFPTAQEGDRIRFMLYYHNNGNDQYDEDESWNSPDATNVEIGMELNNIEETGGMIRPRGFIKATNNRYQEVNSSHVPYDLHKNDDYLIEGSSTKATDDMQILIPEGLELKVEGGWWLEVQSANPPLNGAIPSSSEKEIKFNTDDGEVKIYTKGYKSISDNKMWIHFDKIPGCFKYSGFAYFDAIFVEDDTPTPTCNDLDAHPSDDPTVNETMYFQPTVKDEMNGNFGSDVKFTVNPTSRGEFRKDGTSTWTTNLTVSPSGGIYPKVYFKGYEADSTPPSPIKIDALDTEVSGCTEYYDIKEEPEPPLTCNHLDSTTSDSHIQVGDPTVTFTAVPFSDSHPTDTELFFKEIHYSTTGNNGKFGLEESDITHSTLDTIPGIFIFFPTFTFVPIPVYFDPITDGTNSIVIDTKETGITACTDKYTIYEEPAEVAECASLTVTPNSFTTTSPDAQLTVTGFDTDGIALPAFTMTVWNKTTTASKIYLQALPWLDIAASHTPTPISFKPWINPISPAGQLNVTIDPSDPRYSPACVGTINVTEIPLPNQCQNISATPDTHSGHSGFPIYVTGNYGDFTGDLEFTTSPSGYGTFKHNGTPNTQFSIDDSEEGIEFVPNTAVTPPPGSTYTINIKAVGENAGPCQDSIIITIPINPGGNEAKCTNLEIKNPSGTWTESDFTGTNEQKFEIKVTIENGGPNSFDYEWKVSESGAGTWKETDDKYNNGKNTLEDIDTDKLEKVEVWAKDKDNGTKIKQCSAEILFEESTPPSNPKIEKFVWDIDSNKKAKTLYLSSYDQGETITYIGEYEVKSTSKVDIEDAGINPSGKIKPTAETDVGLGGALDYKGILITYGTDDSQTEMYKNNFDLNKMGSLSLSPGSGNYNCTGANLQNICVKNPENLSSGRKITFIFGEDFADNQKVYIYYQFINHSAIKPAYCDKPDEGKCGENFPNTIQATAELKGLTWTGKDSASVIVTCPFFLVRESGDALFHEEFYSGVDISICSPVHNGPIVIRPKKDKNENLPSTGTGTGSNIDSLINSTHDVCKLSNLEESEGNTLPIEYHNVFKFFSSSVCEMESFIGIQWKKPAIITTMSANVTRIARWEKNLSGTTDLDLSTPLADLINAKSGVFVTDKDLTIGSNGTYKIKKANGIPAAQTYIVIGADLTINSNIEYEDYSNNTSPANPKDIPSAAFIVINGNINIRNSVTKIDGILMAMDTSPASAGLAEPSLTSTEKGRICALNSLGKTSCDKSTYDKYDSAYGSIKSLTINGSIVGDIANLFVHRKFSGNPMKDQGSITIKYDERLLLNTPPGLSELIDLNQLRVAH